MSAPLLRHWAMLQLIPRFPRKVSTTQLHSRLEEMSYPIDLRSVQRDLVKLSAIFPLVSDNNSPAGWSWDASAPPFNVPGMDAHTAITFRLVEQQLVHYLPRTTLEVLKPHFKVAHGVLAKLKQEGLPSWGDKVRATPRGQPLLAPKVSPLVLSAVYDALLEERRLEVRYRNRMGKESTGVIHPLGLVYRDALPVLVCTWAGFEQDVRQLTLPRMERAKVLEEKRKAPKGFNLARYVEEGFTAVKLSPEPVRLVARFHPEAAPSVVETPLHESQTHEVEDDGWVRVEATVADTRVLRGWLLSFGHTVEVLSPPQLREGVHDALQEALALYREPKGARARRRRPTKTSA